MRTNNKVQRRPNKVRLKRGQRATSRIHRFASTSEHNIAVAKIYNQEKNDIDRFINFAENLVSNKK